MAEHIVKSFDDELVQLNRAIARMGELSQTQLSGAIDSLLLRDTTVAAHVVTGDFEVDEIERELDARAIRVPVNVAGSTPSRFAQSTRLGGR